MSRLTDAEKRELRALIEADQPLPAAYRDRLFTREPSVPAATPREYKLVYDGKLTREEVLAQTPAAPWQLERSFCADRPHRDGWRNLLVWGDNLLALRELLADQQGANRLGTRGKIKLIYIDPPFATRQDFLKDKEKAYRDKVLGAQFIEFLRRRLILLREILADDGSIFVHLDWKKGHYLKATLDEVFGEENFVTEILGVSEDEPPLSGCPGLIAGWLSTVTKLAEIQTAIRQLAPQEQLALRHWFDEATEETPEMLAAIDAGAHSLAENGGREPTRAELEARVTQWAGGSR